MMIFTGPVVHHGAQDWCTMPSGVPPLFRNRIVPEFASHLSGVSSQEGVLRSRAGTDTTKLLSLCTAILLSQHGSVPLQTARGCGLARYGDGLQRSLRSFVLADDEQWVY